MSATQERTANDLRVEAQALAQRRNELAELYRGAMNTKTSAISSGDARTLMDADRQLLELGPAIVSACAQLDMLLDNFKAAVDAEFVRDHRQAERDVEPLREQIARLVRELASLEDQERTEAAKAAPEVNVVVGVKRDHERWFADEKTASREAIRRLHPQE